jgi:hypothetical protein
VAALLDEHLLLLKIDGANETTLVEKLAIQSYPTLVFAAPNGKILETMEGFVDAATLCKYLGHVLKIVEASKDPTGGTARVKALNARELLDRICEDDRNEQLATCLLRCKSLADAFQNSPEAAEAQRLADQKRSDPQRARRARKDLADAFGGLPYDSEETRN